MDYELIAALAFYVIVILLIYFNRKKFEFQAKIIGLYRMKIGLKTMDRISTKYPRTVKWFGYTGIVVGFIGMFIITAMLFYGAYNVFFVPEAPASIQPVLPGLPIPGSPMRVPLIAGLLSIFLVATIHEFSHGVVARRYNLKVKNTGIFFIGPIFGAFVEPDENAVAKAPLVQKLSIFAAGSYSNILLATFAGLLLFFVLSPGLSNFYDYTGLEVISVQDDFPAKAAGVQTEDVITEVNGERAFTLIEFSNILSDVEIGEVVKIKTQRGLFDVSTVKRPDGEGAYIGIIMQSAHTIKEKYIDKPIIVSMYAWFFDFIWWLMIISFGIGLFNLAPLGPIDGGRMVLDTFMKYMPKIGKKAWLYISLTVLAILAINFIPFFKALFRL